MKDTNDITTPPMAPPDGAADTAELDRPSIRRTLLALERAKWADYQSAADSPEGRRIMALRDRWTRAHLALRVFDGSPVVNDHLITGGGK